MSANDTYLIKGNKCLEQYTPPVVTGDNAYIINISPTESLGTIIGDCEMGVSIGYVMGNPDTSNYPVVVPVSTQSSNRAILTIIKDSAATVFFEYDGDLYFAHYYTNTQGLQLSDWKQLITTGGNAYITVDDTTANLSDIITAADEGVTMYIAPPPMGTAQGYPVDISTLIGVPAIVTIIKPVPNYAQINFEYNDTLYFTHCYIGQSGAQLSTWQQVNTTAV